MSDAQRPKNDGDIADEQADANAPASDDASAADQTSGATGSDADLTRGGPDPDTAVFSADGADGFDDAGAGQGSATGAAAPGSAEPSGDAPSSAAREDASAPGADSPDSATAGDARSASESAPADAASGTTVGAASARGTASTTSANDGSATPASVDARGDDMADSGSSEEPDYEALAAELDRLESDAAVSAPVAPGAREPEPTDKAADPWFEPATSDTFNASDPQQQTALDEPNATPSAAPTSTAAPGPIFVQAPEPPRKRGNRGAAGLIGLVAALVFGLLYAVANYGWEIYVAWGAPIGEGATDPALFATDVLLTPPFWFTVVAFWLSFWLLGVFVNRARWWSWVVLGIIVALLTYLGFIVGHFLEAPFWNLTADEGSTLLGNLVFSPIGLVALILAREVTIWFGSWASRRGARVTKLNEEERAEYDKVMAEGPKAPASA